MRAHDKGPMDQFSAHLDRGWDLIARGDLAGAMISARKTLELDADSPEAHNLIGYIHAAEGQAEEALEHYRQAIDSDDTFVEAMLNAAEVLLHPLADYEGAVEMIDDALDLCQSHDEMADALLLKIDVLLHANERERAAHVARDLPEGPFENDHLEFLVGRAFYEVGFVEEAAPRIQRALELEPDNADTHYYLGLMRESQGDHHAAATAFLQARELDVRGPPPPWSTEPQQFERIVQSAIHRLHPPRRDRLDGALVVVCDMPGAEVVADGVDPRTTVLVDDGREGSTERAVRVFVYQRNVERLAGCQAALEDEVVRGLERELMLLFPGESPPGEAGIAVDPAHTTDPGARDADAPDPDPSDPDPPDPDPPDSPPDSEVTER